MFVAYGSKVLQSLFNAVPCWLLTGSCLVHVVCLVCVLHARVYIVLHDCVTCVVCCVLRVSCVCILLVLHERVLQVHALSVACAHCVL